MGLLDYVSAFTGGMIDRNWAKRDASDQAQANERGAERAQDFSSAEAVANRNFQERMSNTSWQRGTADMMAAGINPMLAFQQGGASSPSGSQGSGFAAQGSTVRGTQGLLQQAATAAQIENIQADTDNKRAENPNIRNQARVQDAMVDNLKAQTAQLAKQQDLTEAQTAQVNQAIENLKAQLDNLKKENIQIEEETLLTHARRWLTKEQTTDTRVNRVLSMLDLPKAVNEAMAEQTWWKKEVAPFMGDAGRVINSAGEIVRRRQQHQMNRYIIQGK